MHVCEPHECSAHKSQKKVLNPVELKELQNIVSHHVGAIN